MRILRAADRIARPWKNGTGRTTQIAVSPASEGVERFDWRVSLADIVEPCPFSTFPGVDRNLSVVAGGLALVVGDRAPIILSPQTEPLVFAGEDAASAEPLDGPVLALNVMVGRGRYRARLDRVRVQEEWRTSTALNRLLVLLLQAGFVAFDDAHIPLSSLDALFLEPGECFTVFGQSAVLDVVLIDLTKVDAGFLRTST